MKEKVLAEEFFSNGKNCAQSVLMAFGDRINLSAEQTFAIASGFGGGIAKNGEVCGAVSGAVMVIGLLNGKPGDNPEEAKARVAKITDQFIEEFKVRQQSIICRELIEGVDLKTSEGQNKWADKNMHKYNCLPAVTTAVEILKKLV
jgi:C_GCAxxG_C_C family probable redox protein